MAGAAGGRADSCMPCPPAVVPPPEPLCAQHRLSRLRGCRRCPLLRSLGGAKTRSRWLRRSRASCGNACLSSCSEPMLPSASPSSRCCWAAPKTRRQQVTQGAAAHHWHGTLLPVVKTAAAAFLRLLECSQVNYRYASAVFFPPVCSCCQQRVARGGWPGGREAARQAGRVQRSGGATQPGAAHRVCGALGVLAEGLVGSTSSCRGPPELPSFPTNSGLRWQVLASRCMLGIPCAAALPSPPLAVPPPLL